MTTVMELAVGPSALILSMVGRVSVTPGSDGFGILWCVMGRGSRAVLL